MEIISFTFRTVSNCFTIVFAIKLIKTRNVYCCYSFFVKEAANSRNPFFFLDQKFYKILSSLRFVNGNLLNVSFVFWVAKMGKIVQLFSINFISR